MKVCVGIPAYKAQKTIEECLSSVNVQSMKKDVNVIISNDNPGDDYTYLNERFPDLHIEYIDTDKNAGPGTARNRVIEKCTDDFLTFIDADDVFWSPYALETLYTAVNQPGVIMSMGTFTSPVNTPQGVRFINHNEPDHPWVFGKMISVPFIKQNGIFQGNGICMEDGEWNWKIRLLIEGTNLKINKVNDIVYLWKEGSEHSITRSGTDINGGIPVYNFGMCQIGAAIAARNAIKFVLDKNPFNGNVQRFALMQMIGHYFTYYESLEKKQPFTEQLWWLSQWYYHNVYKVYCSNLSQDIVDKFYMQILSQKGKTLSKFPELTFEQWFNEIKTKEFSMEQLVEIRKKIPQAILDVEKKSGSINKTDILNIF